MNYLSRISNIDGDDYKVHQYLKSIFPTGKILFQRNMLQISIISEDKPSEKSIKLKTLPVKEYLEKLSTNQDCLFTIRLNPVISRSINNKVKRSPVPQAQLKDWITAKLESTTGATCEFIHVTEGARISSKGEHLITLSSVFVTGVCTIQNPDKFRASVYEGIGHAKGLGFGMLNIFANL